MVLEIFQKIFRIPEDQRPKCLMAQQFFQKIFHGPLPSNIVSYLRLACSSISRYCSVTFKFKITKESAIHNNIQKIIS